MLHISEISCSILEPKVFMFSPSLRANTAFLQISYQYLIQAYVSLRVGTTFEAAVSHTTAPYNAIK
jgi:hypothetical protein